MDNSEITLKAITYKQGQLLAIILCTILTIANDEGTHFVLCLRILGLNQLLDQVVAEWLQDIKTYQLPHILQGVGPLYHATQLCIRK